MTNKANNKNEMSKREQKDTRGGSRVGRRKTPPFPLVVHEWNRPTWKYVDGTPSGSIANAEDMGYETENIC